MTSDAHRHNVISDTRNTAEKRYSLGNALFHLMLCVLPARPILALIILSHCISSTASLPRDSRDQMNGWLLRCSRQASELALNFLKWKKKNLHAKMLQS